MSSRGSRDGSTGDADALQMTTIVVGSASSSGLAPDAAQNEPNAADAAVVPLRDSSDAASSPSAVSSSSPGLDAGSLESPPPAAALTKHERLAINFAALAEIETLTWTALFPCGFRSERAQLAKLSLKYDYSIFQLLKLKLFGGQPMRDIASSHWQCLSFEIQYSLWVRYFSVIISSFTLLFSLLQILSIQVAAQFRYCCQGVYCDTSLCLPSAFTNSTTAFNGRFESAFQLLNVTSAISGTGYVAVGSNAFGVCLVSQTIQGNLTHSSIVQSLIWVIAGFVLGLIGYVTGLFRGGSVLRVLLRAIRLENITLRCPDGLTERYFNHIKYLLYFVYFSFIALLLIFFNIISFLPNILYNSKVCPPAVVAGLGNRLQPITAYYDISDRESKMTVAFNCATVGFSALLLVKAIEGYFEIIKNPFNLEGIGEETLRARMLLRQLVAEDDRQKAKAAALAAAAAKEEADTEVENATGSSPSLEVSLSVHWAFQIFPDLRKTKSFQNKRYRCTLVLARLLVTLWAGAPFTIIWLGSLIAVIVVNY